MMNIASDQQDDLEPKGCQMAMMATYVIVFFLDAPGGQFEMWYDVIC